MRLPLPAKAPLMLDELCTIQVNVVPETPFGFVITMDVDEPEQIV
jgi:hypothetical protein